MTISGSRNMDKHLKYSDQTVIAMAEFPWTYGEQLRAAARERGFCGPSIVSIWEVVLWLRANAKNATIQGPVHCVGVVVRYDIAAALPNDREYTINKVLTKHKKTFAKLAK
jgi:hypothetical protein